jgi:hypothetical protein
VPRGEIRFGLILNGRVRGVKLEGRITTARSLDSRSNGHASSTARATGRPRPR